MAGKYNKGRCRRGSQNSLASPKSTVSSDHSRLKYNGTTFEPPKSDAANETTTSSDPTVDSPETEAANGAAATQVKQGDLHLYPVPVKTQSGEKLELQLNPGDSVMDIRQFLLDAPETCYFTCYDLLLHAKDGSTYHLEDYNEISEVADITAGGCSLEMVSALYDERSIRAHVNRTRDLLSLATLHASLSTSLALQHEAAEHKDAMKIDVPELDGLGFMEDVAGSVGKLLAPSSREIKSVESIVFSSLNPPPSYRRLMGDLIYLDIITLEGNKYCISGTTMMFYVNSTTGNVLDPRPTKTSSEATTLIGLLQKISSKFKKAFREIVERKSAAHPFENVQSLLPPNSWLGLYPIPDHKRDSARAEDAVTLSYGSELIGMQRDWNEELQSCREFPHSTPQERILRDRALYKVTSDFVDAATSGAIGVINRCIPPINPTDPECFHMYVHNNIFFSFAVDADIEQLSKRHASDLCLSDQTGKESVGLIGKGSVDMLEKNGGFAHSEKCPISVVSDTKSLLESNEDSAETKLVESEQATYASANNDLKGTKAYQEADVPGLYNLAMAIIDYRGHRVVAQSVLPGILQGDKSDSLLYGSVDNGKKICWNEDFHSKVLEAAKHLHLKEHKVLDGSGDIFKLAAPVECKGIVGSDDRHYLLDLMRVSPRDANYMGPGSRFCILRPEIITSFCQAQAAESSQFNCKSQGEADKATSAPEVGEVADFVQNGPSIGPTSDDHKDLGKLVSSGVCKQNDSEDVGSSDSCEEIQFNPNVFTEFQLTGGLEEMAADEENVRKVGSYLVDVAIPKFIQDLCTLEVSPMDGQSLTEALHAHGINVRYIGKVANGTKHLPHLWDLCSNEIVVRSAKHILKDILRETEDHDLGHAICHFLNCFFGNCQAVGVKSSSPQPKTKKDQVAHHTSGKSSRNHSRWKRASSRKNVSVYVNVSSETLWSDIQEFAKLKYQFYLPDDSQSRVKKVSVLRNFCQKLGITVAARKYDLNVAAPFQTADVLNLQPVVKHSVPVCLEAKELVELGKVQLAEGMLNDAYTLFSEAFSILQQVTGPLHREVANCCRYLAMVLYHAGDMAGAIMQQHKELIINERCLGLDHPDTAHSYGNMALFYHGLNRTELALRHMSQALLLLGLSSGPDHPDVAATFINVAMMYQDIGKMNTALRYLQQALIKNERLLGEEHIQTAVCYHALAIAWNCMGNFKLSYQHEKRTYDILVKQLGEEDSRARDSKNWMKTFKMRELQKGQDSDTTSTQKAIDFLKANPDLLQAFQAAAAAGGSPKPGASVHKSLNVVFGQTFPRGRGFDERAARAAAEARKKAAARRLAGRPHDVPVQALPPLSQLLNIINSETKSEADDTNESRDIIANGRAQDVLVEANKEQTSKEADQAPVGLGTGLTSLGAKKRKNKNKGTA